MMGRRPGFKTIQLQRMQPLRLRPQLSDAISLHRDRTGLRPAEAVAIFTEKESLNSGST
jgi:hypothetical protein